MQQIVVVGSGASAVHFALSALEKGHRVLMLDVGGQRPQPVLPQTPLHQLKTTLDNPTDYFLGPRFEAVLFPGNQSEYYGFPPSKSYVFSGLPQFQWRSEGFSPLYSFARGGLAESWTGGSYPFNDAELADFPFGYKELSPYYDLVAQRIGISGAVDDLARFMPVHRDLMPAARLDEHSAVLLEKYQRHREALNTRHDCYVGRSRVAVLTEDKDGRKACCYLGRCLWGCPTDSLYTPAITLEACRRFDRFQYVPGVFVRHFTVKGDHRVKSVVIERVQGGSVEEVPVNDSLVLAAGTLSSSRIFLESIFQSSGQMVTLRGLMDNQQILMPFVTPAMLRKPYSPETYQYHQLGLGLEDSSARAYIHGQITTLKTGLIHPIVQHLPADLRTSLSIFRNAHAALGLVNINLHDTRRDVNLVSLEPVSGEDRRRLRISYQVGPGEQERVATATKRVKRVLSTLGCFVPPGMTHVRPVGASVHYAGLLPMSDRNAEWATTPHGKSREFDNLYFADGTTFPFLPAKNITFTLMANAARIAESAF